MGNIKFRAWHQQEKKMYQVRYIDFVNKIAEVGNGWDSFKVKDRELILLQFTGLKDKFGKQIYEGDIIKHNDPFGNGFGVVQKDGCSWGLSDDDGFCDDWNFKDWEEDFEIVGNVHKNKGLTAFTGKVSK